ncbi:hypothetical protein [Rhodoferax sp.]|uniref:hypothetical protein n=1 Tax=Rhodoferax sp. TaxID=50421 RepID=UPI0019E363C9|nr:hypothetical protein [Rhodoferax sp.]MBE0475204.1 hypothetical protein [Rhodoferax sp.]
MQENSALVQRLSDALEVINVRIARLASALRVPLNDDSALHALMSAQPAQPVVNERCKTSIALARVNLDADRRQAHLQEELRGLLVLRYRMEASSLDANGLTVTEQAMVQVEEHLLRRGFKPGADGLRLDEFF